MIVFYVFCIDVVELYCVRCAFAVVLQYLHSVIYGVSIYIVLAMELNE